MFGYISETSRATMFDHMSEEKLQAMAEDQCMTVPELKERLLEFAAFHGFDTLDFQLDLSDMEESGDKLGSALPVQLDGAPGGGLMDCDTFDPFRTPNKTVAMFDDSDDSDSTSESSDLFLTRYNTPATSHCSPVKCDENGSPKQVRIIGHADNTMLTCQTDGPSSDNLMPSANTPLEWDGSLIGSDGQPISRMFDHKISLKHRDVPEEHLLAYNPDKQVMHLRSIEPTTGALQTDLHTLVVTIEGVVYEDAQAGAAVFHHYQSPWNTVTWVGPAGPQTRENAQLEALYTVLHMIRSVGAKDPSLSAVRIMCAGVDFCMANAIDRERLGPIDRNLADEWRQNVDQATFWEVSQLWDEINEGSNGHRAVDVRLWCVSKEMVRPVTDMAMAYMYEEHGRDWHEENGEASKGQSKLEPAACRVDFVATAKATLELATMAHGPVLTPPSVTEKGPEAASKWVAESKAKLQQALLYTIVASEGRQQLVTSARGGPGRRMCAEEFFLAQAAATGLTVAQESARQFIDQFMAEQRAIGQGIQPQTTEMPGRYTGDVAGAESSAAVSDVEKLIQQVLETEWM